MEYVSKYFLLLAVPLSGLLSAVLIFVFRKEKFLKEVIYVVCSVIMFLSSLFLAKEIINGNFVSFELFKLSPTLTIFFSVDRPAILFAILASFLWIITNFYSFGYLKGTDDKKDVSFYCFFSLTLFATTALAFSGNLITTFLFYELITIFTYPLVTHKANTEAIIAGRKYFAYLMGLSIIFFLSAIFLTYGFAGNLDFSESGVFTNVENKKILLLILMLFFFGIAKTAVIPFHHWLPTAMIAPTPVSALLHAVAVVKAGVFTLYRVLNYIFTPTVILKIDGQYFLIIMSSLTIVLASIIALKQDNLKLRLAYSTISQLSYIVLGFSLLNKTSITAGLMHIIMHAFGKITLFFCAGAIYVKTHKTEISQLKGIGKIMPFTMLAFAVGSLSMIGIPFFGGFVSKYLILNGIYNSGYYWLFFVLGLSTLLNASYFLPIVYTAFFEEEDDKNHKVGSSIKSKEASFFILLPLLITAFFTVFLFFANNYLYEFVIGA